MKGSNDARASRLRASRFRRILGAYELLGGAYGLILAISALFDLSAAAPEGTGGGVVRALVPAILLFGATCGAGIMLLIRHPNGLLLSALVQGLQVVWFATPPFSYYFATGVVGGASITSEGIVPVLRVNSVLLYSFVPESESMVVGLNVIALVLLVLIAMQLREWRVEQASR